MQVQYQRGCLRRLRALGQRHAMDITVGMFDLFEIVSCNKPFCRRLSFLDVQRTHVSLTVFGVWICKFSFSLLRRLNISVDAIIQRTFACEHLANT